MRLCLLHVIEQEKSYKMLIALFTTNYMFSISKKSFPVYIVTYNIKWVNNAWTYSTCYYSWPNLHNFLPPARLCFFNFLAVSGDGGGGVARLSTPILLFEKMCSKYFVSAAKKCLFAYLWTL